MTSQPHASNGERPAHGGYPSASRRPLGYQITITYCRGCAPEGVTESYEPLREGDDYGVPYHCDLCGEDLLPCGHEWGKWHDAFGGGRIRFCNKCGESALG